jgi:hypothetical protein
MVWLKYMLGLAAPVRKQLTRSKSAKVSIHVCNLRQSAKYLQAAHNKLPNGGGWLRGYWCDLLRMAATPTRWEIMAGRRIDTTVVYNCVPSQMSQGPRLVVVENRFAGWEEE